jgi:arylsulfatase A-like enzyme
MPDRTRLCWWFLVVGLVAPAAVPLHAAERPNVLFVFADDWGRHASAYAAIDGPGTVNDLVQTPNFDRVAREGVLFRRAFVSAPSCTPCRSALLSGQHFWRTGRGAILRGAVWDPAIPAFPLLLHDAGYHIGETYKVWGPGTPGDAPYGAGRFAYEKAGGRFNDFSENVTRMVRDGKPVEEAKRSLYDEAAANFDAFLAERKPGEPFCYWFGPTNVHRKWQKGSGKALWGIDSDALMGKVPPFLPDVPEIREDFADYFGEIQALDTMLGRLLERLERTGELENTLIVVSGDHGAPGFTHGKCNLYDFGVGVPLAIRWGGANGGRVVDDLVTLPDLAPTLLEAAGVGVPENMTGRSLVPLLRSEKSGQVDPERTWVLTGRERHVESANEGYLPYPQRAIRTRDYLYIVNFEPDRWPMGNPYGLDGPQEPTSEQVTDDTRVTLQDMDASPTKAWLVAHRGDPQWQRYYDLAFGKRPREELYVLADDPHQVKNVAEDPKFADVRTELHERLMAELRRTGDPRVTGDGSYFERPPLAGPVAEGPDAERATRRARRASRGPASDASRAPSPSNPDPAN